MLAEHPDFQAFGFRDKRAFDVMERANSPIVIRITFGMNRHRPACNQSRAEINCGRTS
jgi:hypothetical protein